jgi:hypothetical protein
MIGYHCQFIGIIFITAGSAYKSIMIIFITVGSNYKPAVIIALLDLNSN